MKWEPWNEYDEVRGDPVLPIPEPPCKECYWWQPRQVIHYSASMRSSNLDSIRCCWASNMHFDFSCYRSMSDVPEYDPMEEEL